MDKDATPRMDAVEPGAESEDWEADCREAVRVGKEIERELNRLRDPAPVNDKEFDAMARQIRAQLQAERFKGEWYCEFARRLREQMRVEPVAWIPLQTSQPNAGDVVLVWAGRAVQVYVFGPHDFRVKDHSYSGGWRGIRATHWMPLSEGPK